MNALVQVLDGPCSKIVILVAAFMISVKLSLISKGGPVVLYTKHAVLSFLNSF